MPPIAAASLVCCCRNLFVFFGFSPPSAAAFLFGCGARPARRGCRLQLSAFLWLFWRRQPFSCPLAFRSIRSLLGGSGGKFVVKLLLFATLPPSRTDSREVWLGFGFAANKSNFFLKWSTTQRKQGGSLCLSLRQRQRSV